VQTQKSFNKPDFWTGLVVFIFLAMTPTVVRYPVLDQWSVINITTVKLRDNPLKCWQQCLPLPSSSLFTWFRLSYEPCSDFISVQCYFWEMKLYQSLHLTHCNVVSYIQFHRVLSIFAVMQNYDLKNSSRQSVEEWLSFCNVAATHLKLRSYIHLEVCY
jgi:hypothetical protein